MFVAKFQLSRFVVFTLATGIIWLSNAITTADAQEAARKACCLSMGGRYEARSSGYGGDNRCFGVASNAFYSCVAAGGPGKSKKK